MRLWVVGCGCRAERLYRCTGRYEYTTLLYDCPLSLLVRPQPRPASGNWVGGGCAPRNPDWRLRLA